VATTHDDNEQHSDFQKHTGAARNWIRSRVDKIRARMPKRWTARYIAALIVSGIFALFIVALVWLYFLDWNTMRGPVSRYLSHSLGREVHITGNLDVHLFSLTPRASVSGLTVGNPQWVGTPKAADIGRTTVAVKLLPLFRGQWILPLVRIDHPKILITRAADGRTNWDFGGDKGQGWTLPPINQFLIRDGHLKIEDRVRKLLFTGNISSEERNDGQRSAFTLAGDGTLNGNKFLANIQGGPLLNVDETQPYSFTANVSSGQTKIYADGSIPHPFHLGQFSAITVMSGANLSDLYDLTGLAMPRTPAYKLQGTISRDGTIWRFVNFKGLIGSSDLQGDLAVDTGRERTYITGAVKSKTITLSDLGATVGSGPAHPTPSGQIFPDTQLHVDRLRQMDADVTYDASEVRSQDLPLRGLHTHIAINNGVMLLKPLTFDFKQGALSGSIRIDARNTIAITALDARLTKMHVEEFLKTTPPTATGAVSARVKIQGAGNSVHAVASNATGAVAFALPGGTFNESIAEWMGIDVFNGLFADKQSNIGLRCAIADFDMKDGVMHSRRLLFDTEPVRVEGAGTLDLKSETMNMKIVGAPKEFRIGRIRAPIKLDGPIAHPDIGIEAGPALTQGGIATLLGVLFPPAAILPFIDPGMAKDANCSDATPAHVIKATARKH
jgi:uncharacterized protein involved in outer membrane biogenesis